MSIEIPETVEKDIDEIKSKSNRILLKCLILALMTVFGLWLNAMRSGKNDCKDEVQYWKNEATTANYKYDSLRFHDQMKTDQENERLKRRVDSMLNLNNKLEKITQ